MSTFEQLKMIYSQFSNIADEIKSMINNEEYNEAISKIQYKETLIEKLALVKNNIIITDAEKEEMLEIEAEFIKKEKSNLDFLTGLHADVAVKLREVNQSLKITKAYAQNTTRPGGSILDMSE